MKFLFPTVTHSTSVSFNASINRCIRFLLIVFYTDFAYFLRFDHCCYFMFYFCLSLNLCSFFSPFNSSFGYFSHKPLSTVSQTRQIQFCYLDNITNIPRVSITQILFHSWSFPRPEAQQEASDLIRFNFIMKWSLSKSLGSSTVPCSSCFQQVKFKQSVQRQSPPRWLRNERINVTHFACHSQFWACFQNSLLFFSFFFLFYTKLNSIFGSTE